jgi:hypothetical protein
MTSGTGTSGIEPVTAPGIHDETVTPAAAPFTPQQFFGIGQALLNGVGAFVLYALAGVQVFGVAPFGFLRSWADDLAQRANDAYSGAVVAQSSADTANTGIAILNARINGLIIGGAVLYDTFDRDVADIASDPAYDVTYINGPGSMGLSSSSSGIAFWNPVGFSDAFFLARDTTTPMTTNTVRVSTVVSDFTYGSSGNQATIRIAGRMSADKLNYVVAIVQINWAEIGYVVGGTYTRLGAQEAVTVSSGDLWDLEIGEHGGDEWQFTLKQNNAVRVIRNDLGHASMKDTTPGTTYKWVGFAGDCAVGLGPFFTTYQIGMPNFQVLAAADF